MRNFLFVFICFLGFHSILFSQQLETLNYEKSDVLLSGIDLSENWKTELVYNTILVTNGSIKNNSNKNYRGLILKMFLLPSEDIIDPGFFKGYKMTEANFNVLNNKSSLIGIKIQSEVNQIPPNGLYLPALIMTNRSGRIMSFRVLDDIVKSEDGILYITGKTQMELPDPGIEQAKATEETTVEPVGQETLKTPPASEQKKFSTDPNSVVKITIKDDHSLSLDKQWQVEILPKEFLVNIKGGDISNLSDKNVKNLTLDVFLTDKMMDIVESDFNGVRIASANIGEIDSYKKYIDTQVKASMINIPQSGTYHILLTISATDENGNQVVRTGKYFERPVSF